MFFTKQDRNKLNNILKHMATRAQLDAALKQEKQDVTDAIERHEQALKDLADLQSQAIVDLQSKLDAGEDYSDELATLSDTHQQLQTLAATPVNQIVGSGSGASFSGTTTGAAGTTVAGPTASAAAEAQGGKLPEGQGDHPGNIPTPHNPNPDTDKTEPQTETETTGEGQPS